MPSLASSTATTNAATAPTSSKMENKTPANAPSSSLDVPESLKAVLTIVEKKVRNLEKRKSRLDGYREEMARGKSLDAEQRLAVARYDEVIQNLELARELTKQFDKIASDTSKEEKKRKKREVFEKQQSELTRFKELFTIKEALSCAVRSDSREHFLNGTQGAILLEEADLAKLQAFNILISLDRPDLPGGLQEAVGGAAQHFQLLLEGRSKEVAGSSYKELKDLLSRVSKCAYFDWKIEAPTTEVIPTDVAPEAHVIQEEPVYEPANGEAPVVVESVPAIAAPIMTPAPQVVPLQAPASYFPVELNTDFNFIQDSLIDCKAPIPAPTAAALPVAVPPVSLASMDSAVVMVHAQVPHGHPHAHHHLAYSFLQGAPAPAPLFHPAAHNPLSGVPQSMIQQPQLPVQQTIDVPVHEAEPLAQEPPQPVQEQPQVEQRSSPTWAEEVDDESQPFQQQQHKNESNTWTNSNYRPNDHEFSGRGRGGYRGRGGGRGGPRGGGPSGGQGNYFNSRGGSGGYGGSSDQRNSYYNSHSGGSQGNNGYRGRGGGGSYGARNNGGGGGYRGNGSSRGAPRGAPRGGYDRNN